MTLIIITSSYLILEKFLLQDGQVKDRKEMVVLTVDIIQREQVDVITMVVVLTTTNKFNSSKDLMVVGELD